MALTASNASFVYDAGTAYSNRGVTGVTLTVTAGRLALVLGPTGSGKSTLLRLLAGLLQPTSGEILADGAAVTVTGTGERATVGLVFQDPERQLFAETVAADVAFGPRNLGAGPAEAARVAEEALRAVALDPAEFGPRSPFGLSGGEARRVAVAGVLAMRPSYLLLDEPTAGLDATGRLAVHNAIRDLKASAGIVVVTHDAEEFLDLADDVLVLADGAPAFAGIVEGLLVDPALLTRAGLLMPDVLRAQVLAEEHGAVLDGRSTDPAIVAAKLVSGAWWQR